MKKEQSKDEERLEFIREVPTSEDIEYNFESTSTQKVSHHDEKIEPKLIIKTCDIPQGYGVLIEKDGFYLVHSSYFDFPNKHEWYRNDGSNGWDSIQE